MLDTEGLRERGSGRVLGTAGNATGGCNEGARGGGTEEAKVQHGVSQSGARVQVLHCHVVRRAVEVGRELGAHNQLRHRRKLGHGGGRQKGSEVVKG